MNSYVVGAIVAGAALGAYANKEYHAAYPPPIVSGVEIERVALAGAHPIVDGTFIRADRPCELDSVIGLVGSPAGWDRVKVEIRGAPDTQVGPRPPGLHKFRGFTFLDAKNISGKDLLRAVTVHHCDTSGTGRKITNPVTGKQEFAEFKRVETEFFTVAFPVVADAR